MGPQIVLYVDANSKNYATTYPTGVICCRVYWGEYHIWVEFAEGAQHHRRQRLVYAYVVYFLLSLPAWGYSYIWQQAKYCPY